MGNHYCVSYRCPCGRTFCNICQTYCNCGKGFSDYTEYIAKSLTVPHVIECNYQTKPIGSPGCVCVVVNRNNIIKMTERMLELERKLSDQEGEEVHLSGWKS